MFLGVVVVSLQADLLAGQDADALDLVARDFGQGFKPAPGSSGSVGQCDGCGWLHGGQGETVESAVGEVHRLANRSQDPVDIVEVQFGHYLGEDDIERLGDDYGRT